MSRARLIDAHLFWQKDLSRVSEFDLGGKDPDHFKRAGHLAYWIRRCAPISMLVQEDLPRDHRLPDEAKLQRAKRYANEITAFDIGWRIVSFFESRRSDATTSVLMLGRRRDHIPINEHVLSDDFRKRGKTPGSLRRFTNRSG